LEKLLITNLGSTDVIFGWPWFKENNPQIVWKTGKVQLPKADLDTTFLYLAKDRQRRKEIEEEDKFQKELLQQSSSKRNRTEPELTLLGKKKAQQSNHETGPRTPPIEEKQRLGRFYSPQNERTIRFNEIETRTEPEPISPDWRKQRQNKGKFPVTGNPSTRRTEQITK